MPGIQTASQPYTSQDANTKVELNPKAARPEAQDQLIGVIVLVTCILLVTNSLALEDILTRPYGAEVKDAVVQAIVAFMLNLALLLIGWRRYRELQKEISNYVVAEKRAKHLAVTDPLTGFYNRRAIADLTSELMAKAEEKGQEVAFLLLDVDDFKQVNDVHGHSTGDFLLREIARRIRRLAPKRAYLSRIGGDEFAFVFSFDPKVPQEVTRFAESIISEMQRPFVHNDSAIASTVTIGIARSISQEGHVSDLMRRADMAMYEAKRAGKNSICWFDSTMEDRLLRKVQIETAVRQGVETDEFIPYFEPVIDLKSGHIIGFEMLARWNNDEYRDVGADRFIQIAQDINVIGALSQSLIEKALIEARDWDSSLMLAINISPVQLLDEKLAQQILKLLVMTGFPPNRLEIEVTESAIFQNVMLARTIIQSLKNQGVRVAYDDFGTGYSSLTHLRELPFDRIKIDRSFISASADDEASANLVKAIIALCNTLGLPITAEGIESEEIHNQLVELGDMAGQGHFYSHPLSIAKTRKLLAERNLLPSRRQTREVDLSDSIGGIAIKKAG